MIIDRLQISGFLSYNEKVDIDFSKFDLACISGANGAGKSTLLEAITWALFGEARRRDDAIINSHSKTAEVILDFDYEGLRYQVQRSKTHDKSTLLEFRIQTLDRTWKALTEATLRATEEMICKSLHLDYETFINASFFLQGKADQFAQQRPADRKRILSTILGLEIWESYKDETTRRRRAQESEQAIVDALLIEIDSELKEEGARKKRLSDLESELASRKTLFAARKALLDQHRLLADRVASDKKLLEKQSVELQRQQQELDQTVEDLHLRLQDKKSYQLQVEGEDAVRLEIEEWKSARQVLTDWENIATNFREFEARRQAPLLIIEGESARLHSELGNLRQKEGEMQQLSASIPNLEQQVQEYVQAVNSLSERMATKPELEANLRALQDTKAHARAENIQLKSEMDELKDRIATLQETSGALCPTCEKPLNADERERLIEDLTARGKNKGDTYRENQKRIDACDQEFHKVETELHGLDRVEADLKLEQRLFDSKSDELKKTRKNLETWQGDGLKKFTSLQARIQTNDFAPEARAELTAIDVNLRQLGYDAVSHESARQKEEAGRASQERLLQLEAAKAALIPLEREIIGLEKSITKAEKHLAVLKDEFGEMETRFHQETANLPDMNQLEKEYYEAQEQVNQSLSEVGYTRNQVEVLDKQREQKTSRLAEKEQLLEQIAQLKILERAFGKDGIPALLIEQALPEIEAHANDILDRLSAGGMSVKFETQREFKDKKRDDRRETLDILIRDSAGERAYELFSGGEAFRVNFAIRLALSRVLSRRAGARLQTLVIDEGFGSQDADGRQRLIEAINLARSDFAKVLVITHLEELKDAFSARIEVTKTAGGSQVQVVAG